MVQIDDPDAGVSQTTYTPFGTVESTTNARGQQVSFTYDDLDRVTHVHPPASEGDVTIDYGDHLKRLSVTGPNYQRSYEYDDIGRVARKTLQVTGLVSKTMLLDFDYDDLDRQTLVTYPDGTLVRYEYEGAYLKRVCEVATASDPCDPNDPNVTSYLSDVSYDELGRRTGTTAPVGTRTFTYDPATRQLQEDVFSGPAYDRDLTYSGYDGVGNVGAITSQSQTASVDFSASYTYDNRDRLASWKRGSDPMVYFGYDSLGNMTDHGVASLGVHNQLFSGSHPHAISAHYGPDHLYGYDADGNRTVITSSSATRYFTFDSRNRLVCEGTSAGACDTMLTNYDVDGMRIRDLHYIGTSPNGYDLDRFYADDLFTLYVGGGNHWADLHIMAFGEEIALKRGDVTLRTASAWGSGWKGLSPPNPIAIASILVSLALVLWVLLGQSPWAPTAPHHPATALVATLLAILIAVPPLPARAGGYQMPVGRRWFLNDPLKTTGVVLLSDGTPESETVYKPFGGVHEEVGSDPNSTIFAGHHLEKNTGLYYMNARWQDPETGTFLSVDPLIVPTDPQSATGYAYARNNPVSNADPTGQCDEPCDVYIFVTPQQYFEDQPRGERFGSIEVTYHEGGPTKTFDLTAGMLAKLSNGQLAALFAANGQTLQVDAGKFFLNGLAAAFPESVSQSHSGWLPQDTGGPQGPSGALSGPKTVHGIVGFGKPFPYEQNSEVDSARLRGRIDPSKLKVGDAARIEVNMRVGDFRERSTVTGETVPAGTPWSYAISRKVGVLPNRAPDFAVSGSQIGIPAQGVPFSYDYEMEIGSQSVRFSASGTMFEPRINF